MILKYKALKHLVKTAIANWKKPRWKDVIELKVATYGYWDDKQIKKINDKYDKYKIKFVRTDNAVFPNTIIIMKNDKRKKNSSES